MQPDCWGKSGALERPKFGVPHMIGENSKSMFPRKSQKDTAWVLAGNLSTDANVLSFALVRLSSIEFGGVFDV